MSSMMSVFTFVVMVFLASALVSEWAARRLVSRIDDRLFEKRDGRGDG